MQVDNDDLAFIGKQLINDFEFYRGRRIFLTGGTGFFGKWLLEAFKYLNEEYQLNISITVLSRSPEKFKENFPYLVDNNKVALVQGDVRNFFIDNENFDLIIHAATDVSPKLNKSHPELIRNTIIDGVKNICKFANNVGCKRVIYTSSGAAYGPQPAEIDGMSEDFVDNPNFDYDDAYASSKLESEEYLKKHANCDVVIARCFTFAGPYLPLNGSYAFGNFIDDFINDRCTVIKGDGKALRSYLYAADLVVWLLRILSSGKNHELYNVGSEFAINVKDLANKISKNEIQVLGIDDGNKNLFLPSVKKAKSNLGLQENFTLEEIINKTKQFYKRSCR